MRRLWIGCPCASPRSRWGSARREGVRGAGLAMGTAAVVLAGLALAQLAVWTAVSIAG